MLALPQRFPKEEPLKKVYQDFGVRLYYRLTPNGHITTAFLTRTMWIGYNQ